MFDKSGNLLKDTGAGYPIDSRFFLVKKVPASDEAEVHRLRSVYNFHFIATKRPDFESATSDQLAEFRILRINKGVSFESALFEAMAKDKVFDNRYKMDYSRPLVRNLKNGSATRALNLLGKGNSKLFNHFGITNVEYTVDDKSTRKNKRTGDDRFKFVRVTKLLPLINDSFTPKKIGENEKGEKLYEQTFDLDDLERVLIDDSNWDEAGNFKIIPVMIEGELKNLRMRLQLSIRSKTFTQTIEGEVLTEEGKAERVSYYFPDMNFKSDNTSSTIDEFPVEFSLTHNVSSLEPTNVSWIANKDVDELVSEFNKAETAETQNPVEEKQDTESKIKRKDLFADGGVFSNELGGSGINSVPTYHTEINGIEFVQFSNPNTGIVDVIMTGTSDNDFVGYYRIYENGKPTEKWSSKFENQSRNKENFKTMISGVQSMLPQGHQYTEKTSISTDGLRVWAEQLNRGYELQRDANGNIITEEVSINGDAINNELSIS